MSQKSYRYLIGIDEAGRGPLAGPLVVAGIAVATPFDRSASHGADMRPCTTARWRRGGQAMRLLRGIKDSKRLTEKQRERWFLFLTGHPDIFFATAIISPAVIDRINIVQAAHCGAQKVYDKLSTSIHRCIEVPGSADQNMNEAQSGKQSYTSIHQRIGVKRRGGSGTYCHALLDGSLKLKKSISHQVIIKGDEKIPLISAASVIAKVTRDRLMKKLHMKYPQYGFDEHKGYGTQKHIAAIEKHGYSDIHRKSFLIHT